MRFYPSIWCTRCWSAFLSKPRRARFSRRRRRASAFSEVQTLEVRLALTNSFGFDIVAQGAVDAGSVSVNDFGDVAYLRDNLVLVSDGIAAPRRVSRFIASPFSHTNPRLQINNNGQVGATVTGNITDVSVATLWTGIDAPEVGTTIVAAGRSVACTAPFCALATTSSLSNDGKMAIAALGYNSSTWQVHLSAAPVIPNGATTLVTTIPGGTSFNLMAAEGDRVVIGRARDGVEQVQLFDPPGSGTSTVIASSASGDWNAVGINPGISDDGSVVAFYGVLSASGAVNYGLPAGPGIFASIQTGPVTGDRMLVRADGDLGMTGGGAPIDFSSFATGNRVNVVRQEFGPGGFDADALIVSFIATPNAASPAGAADDPRVFSQNTGIWTNRVDVFDVAAGDYQSARPLRVVQVGDMLDGNAVTSVSLHDGLATPLESPDGSSRIPRRSEHYLAFQASTAADSYGVRANYLHDNPNAAAVAPRKTRITGPILNAADLTPTITWAGLPHVSVDHWELLGYHILSGQEVVNEQVAGDLTTFTMPSDASLGTHEFWVRGHNASGVLPWESDDRFYFHVIATDPDGLIVQVTGPTGSVSDESPTVTWAELPIGRLYDGLIYSVERGMEVARFNGVADTHYQLPKLPTNETYSVYVRAQTIFFGITEWSEPVFFETAAVSPALQAPSDITPTGVTNDPQPQFSWTAPAGAWDFEVKLERQDNGAQVATAFVHLPSYTPPAPLTPGAYIFSVRGRNDALEPGDWGSAPLSVVIVVRADESDPNTPDDSLAPPEGLPDVTETSPVVAFIPSGSNAAPVPTDSREFAPAAAEPETDLRMAPAVDSPPTRTAAPGSAAETSADRVFAEWPVAELDAAPSSSEDQQSNLFPAVAAAGLALMISRADRKAATPTPATSNRSCRRG